MKCLICHTQMQRVKQDFRFKGCYDNFHKCECGTTYTESVRYSQKWREIWRDNDGNIKVIPRKIKRWNAHG